MPCLLTPLLHGAGLVDTGDGIEKKKNIKSKKKETREREGKGKREGVVTIFPTGMVSCWSRVSRQ